MSDDTYAPQIGQSYCFIKGKLVFEDGISYSISEALSLCDPRLTPEDIQAIHLVKKMFDGEILAQPGEAHRTIFSAVNINRDEKDQARSLDDLAMEMGPLPLLKGSEEK